MKWFQMVNWFLTFLGCAIGAGILTTALLSGMPSDGKLFELAIACAVVPFCWAFGWREVWRLVQKDTQE